MISVSIIINNRKTVASISAIRVYPKSKNPRKNTICKYKIYIYNTYIGMLEYPYGNGVNLGIELLKFYNAISEKDLEQFKIIALLENIEKEQKENINEISK